MAFIGLVLSSETFEARGAQGGNSDGAKRCKQEWQELKTLDGRSFKNVGQCVSYAARGGQFAAPDASPAAVCERFDGVPSTETRSGLEVLVCSGLSNYSPLIEEAFLPHCASLTTETRSGQLVVICSPSGA